MVSPTVNAAVLYNVNVAHLDVLFSLRSHDPAGALLLLVMTRPRSLSKLLTLYPSLCNWQQKED